MSNILVFGFFGKNNLGDQLFIDAFQKLFPQHTFTFVDHITKASLNKHYDAVFIGGGSFLDTQPSFGPGVLDVLCSMPIFYIGVGVETDTHQIHELLMKQARLIATRSQDHEKIKEINKNVIYIPDIVYCLEPSKNIKRIDKSVLYLPNIHTIPKFNEPHWAHLSWEYFKHEFAQALDYIIDDGYKVDIFAMCKNKTMDDGWAGIEVSNKMVHRRNYEIEQPKNCIDLFAQYSLVITQRYHGIILAEMAKTPYISIFHHDKLKTSHFNAGLFTSYYETSKAGILNKIYSSNANGYDGLPIKSDMYIELQHRVAAVLNG